MFKCDQFGKGINVYVGKAREHRCPVVAVVAYTYMAVRGPSAGPFFLNHGGRPILKPHFIAELRKELAAAGLDQAAFVGHSFCIRAVTVATRWEYDLTIQMLGRYSSAAFLTYIRTPRYQLASLTRSFM